MMLLALLIASAAAQPPPLQSPTIIVTGQRLQDYRDRLAACLARRCPANEDADATLALAEVLMLEGAYRESRDIVQASLRRNRRQAGAFPEPVSDLYRAHARLSHHLGFANDARRSSFGILGALQEGIRAEDHRHFTARFELAEYLIQSGNIVSARRELARLADSARAAGRADVLALAELRGLWFDYIAGRAGEEGSREQDARLELMRLSRLSEPAQRLRGIGARILLSRIHRIEGRTALADALLAEIGRSDAGRAGRRLLHSPPYQLAEHQIEPMMGATTIRELIGFSSGSGQTPDTFEDKWIDVGFWVMPDGHVSGLEILRRGSNPDWANPLLTSIRGRRYAAGPDPGYRLERYTYTADYERILRSRIPQRSRRARVEYLDLTTEDAAPGPPPAAETPSY